MSIANVLKKLNSRDTRILPSINTLTKIIFIAIIAITATFFVKNILAATSLLEQVQNAQEKGNNAESWHENSWNTNVVNLSNSLTGKIPFKDGSVDTEQLKVKGLLGTANTMIASLYLPQASGVEYIAQIKDNFLGKSTYAQGVAFNDSNNLKALLPVWKVLRNLIYALSSIIFIIIGIMIMLRVKISPQAVITIQNSIPKLITSLILVTFSYAIAGLIIDISVWLQTFVIALLFTAKGVDLNKSLFSTGYNSLIPIDLIPGAIDEFYNFKALTTSMTWTNFSVLVNSTVPGLSMIALGGVVGQVILGSIIGGLTSMIGGTAFGTIGDVIGSGVGWIVGDIGGMIFGVILFILIAIWLIKLFFGLLTTYVTIIIQIVTAPLVIGMGAFPNSKIGFSSWLIDLISKVAVFPVVLIAMVFVNFLIDMFSISGINTMWVPNLLDTGPAGGGDVIRAAIGLAGLAMMSNLPKLVPEAIFSLKPSPFGKAIGEGLTGNFLVKQGQKTANTVQSYGTESILRSFGTKGDIDYKRKKGGKPGAGEGKTGKPAPQG